MKKISILFIVICLFFAGSVWSQGMFTEEQPAQKDNPVKSIVEQSGRPQGIFRINDPSNGGSGAGGGQGGENPAEGPIGDGLLILSLLAGGYCLKKRRKGK
ncbi:MAG: hypothetical protein LBJ17_06720 [Dysgonamonadaceae bacterium]|jgi:hypothetical protein|nr:hypothetical protein [Dysgonamonadaceae bacterium]